MSDERVLRLEACSKFFLNDFDAGRKYLFGRIFWGRRALSEKLQPLAVYPFKDVDFEVRRGEKLNIVGPAKAGKTMLGFLMAGLLAPSTGTLQRSTRVSYFAGLLNFVPRLMTPREYVGFSVYLGGHAGDVDAYSTDEILATADLQTYATRYLRDVPTELLARLRLELLRRSRVQAVVLDQPSEAIWEAFAARPDFDQLAIVVLSRKPQPQLEPFDRLVVMSGGQLVYDGPWQEGLPVYEDVMARAEEEDSPERSTVAEDLSLDESEEDGSEEMDPDEAEEEQAPVGRTRRTRTRRPAPATGELNDRIRTTSDRTGKGSVRIEAVWTTAAPTVEELKGRLTLLSGAAQTLYVWLRVVDPVLIGHEVDECSCLLRSPLTDQRLLLSSSANGPRPRLDRERSLLVLHAPDVTLAPGEYGIRFVLKTSNELQDRVSFSEAVTVVKTVS